MDPQLLQSASQEDSEGPRSVIRVNILHYLQYCAGPETNGQLARPARLTLLVGMYNLLCILCPIMQMVYADFADVQKAVMMPGLFADAHCKISHACHICHMRDKRDILICAYFARYS